MRDRSRVRELRVRLGRITLGEPPAHTWFVRELHAVSNAHGAGIYKVGEDDAGLRLDFGTFAGDTSEDAAARCDQWLRAGGRPWAAYDPRRPQRRQRDRVLVSPAPSVLASARRLPGWIDRARVLRDIEPAIETHYRPIGWDLPTTRVIVCNGPTMLAYVGFTTVRDPTAAQVAILRALAPALKRRLVAERRLAEAGAAVAALDAALDAIAAPAAIVSPRGRVRHASASARRWLEAAPAEARAAIARALAGDGGTRVRLHGDDGYLVVLRGAPLDPALVAARAGARWGLTARQREVLGWLVRGASNLRIAGELGCSERTVEVHVSQILARADVASRAELIAAAWQEATR